MYEPDSLQLPATVGSGINLYVDEFIIQKTKHVHSFHRSNNITFASL